MLDVGRMACNAYIMYRLRRDCDGKFGVVGNAGLAISSERQTTPSSSHQIPSSYATRKSEGTSLANP